MPIRTNRGRAAVYRRLWGWPLRSPRHLVFTVVGVVVVAVAVAVLASHATGARRAAAGPGGRPGPTLSVPAAPTGTPTGSAGSATPAPTQTRLTTPPETPTSAPPAPAALTVITDWGKAWVNHPAGMTNAQWLAQLKPYTTDELLPQMASVDLANIDATQVTGAPQATNSFTSSVEALLPTNDGKLDVTAIATPQGWRVAAYTKAPGP